MKLVTRVGHIFDRILDIAAALTMIMVIFIMLAVSTAVTMRYFGGGSLTWVVDVSSIILLHITFLGAAWLLRSDGHIKVDLVINRLNSRHQSFLNLSTSLIAVLIFAFITWYSAKSTWAYYLAGDYMPGLLQIPKWLVIDIIPIGSFLLFIQSLRRCYGYLKPEFTTSRGKCGHKPEA